MSRRFRQQQQTGKGRRRRGREMRAFASSADQGGIRKTARRRGATPAARSKNRYLKTLGIGDRRSISADSCTKLRARAVGACARGERKLSRSEVVGGEGGNGDYRNRPDRAVVCGRGPHSLTMRHSEAVCLRVSERVGHHHGELSPGHHQTHPSAPSAGRPRPETSARAIAGRGGGRGRGKRERLVSLRLAPAQKRTPARERRDHGASPRRLGLSFFFFRRPRGSNVSGQTWQSRWPRTRRRPGSSRGY